MKMTFVNVFRHLRTKGGLYVCLISLYASKALADLPPVEQPATGGGGGLLDTLKGYAKEIFVFGGLLICGVAFFGVAHSSLTAFHDVRKGKGTWTEFFTFFLIGVGLLLFIIYLLTKAADVL